jgi:hypothetical protein
MMGEHDNQLPVSGLPLKAPPYPVVMGRMAIEGMRVALDVLTASFAEFKSIMQEH